MRWLFGLGIAAALAMWPAGATATPPDCGENVIADPLAGRTVGDQQGGTLMADGFVPSDPPGSIVWNLDPPLSSGCVEVTVRGVTTAGVGEHDIIELFTGPDGSFSDGATDHFLLLKVAGDVFPEVLGQLKVEIGEEFSAIEVGDWSETMAWDPATTYTLAVRLDGAGAAEFYRDDVLLATVDYASINGGDLAFVSMRIPNNGEYQNELPLQGVVFSDAMVWNHEPPAGNSTDTGSPPGDTGVVDDGESTAAGSDGGVPETSTTAGPPPATTSSGPTSSSGASPFPGDRNSGDGGCGCRQVRGSPVAWLLVIPLFRRRRCTRRSGSSAHV